MRLKLEPLSREAFQPYGDVIETKGAAHVTINDGFAERFIDLATIDVTREGGQAAISIAVAQPHPPPIHLRMMERHPLGSQSFIPLQQQDYLIVVADAARPLSPAMLRAFRARGDQGVNYRANVWHHPLLVLEPDSRFLIVDRRGGNNVEEEWFSSLDEPVLIEL
jgi:ureidoglycolate lyase